MVRVSLLDFKAAVCAAAGAVVAAAAGACAGAFVAGAAAAVVGLAAGWVGPLVVAGAPPPPQAPMNTASIDKLANRADNFRELEIDLICVNLPSLVSMTPPPLRR